MAPERPAQHALHVPPGHELLYERRGGNVTVSEICGRANANVAMVKYCFGNKDGLMLALITRMTDSFRTEFERWTPRTSTGGRSSNAISARSCATTCATRTSPGC